MFLSPYVLDYGLDALLRGASRLTLHDYAATEWMLAQDRIIGAKEPVMVTGPSNALPMGRMVTVEPIDDGQILMDGRATHWALFDDHRQIILASAPVHIPFDVEQGNSFTLVAFNIVLPGPVSAISVPVRLRG